MQKRRIERLLLDAPSNLGLRPFIDGHTDYPFPRHPQRYEKDGFTAAGLDLGLATGHGSPELSDIDGLQAEEAGELIMKARAHWFEAGR